MKVLEGCLAFRLMSLKPQGAGPRGRWTYCAMKICASLKLPMTDWSIYLEN